MVRYNESKQLYTKVSSVGCSRQQSDVFKYLYVIHCISNSHKSSLRESSFVSHEYYFNPGFSNLFILFYLFKPSITVPFRWQTSNAEKDTKARFDLKQILATTQNLISINSNERKVDYM